MASLIITELAGKFAEQLRLGRAHVTQRLLNGRGRAREGRGPQHALDSAPIRSRVKDAATTFMVVVLFT